MCAHITQQIAGPADGVQSSKNGELKPLRGDSIDHHMHAFLRNMRKTRVTQPISAEPSTDPAPGVVVDDRYQLIELLGYGGMGAVWKARDTRLRRQVALKTANLPSEHARDRFLAEARLCSRISHRNIVQIYDLGVCRDTVYYTMELIEGRDLATALEDDPPPLPGVVIVLRQIAGALGRMHREGIVHRDIKPSNVMLDESGVGSSNGAVCRLVDFGLAADLRADRIAWAGGRRGRIMGTPSYMSPEQIRGETVDHRSDIYSFGCMAYEAFTGAPPFTPTELLELIELHSRRAPPPLRSAALDRIPAASSKALRRLVLHCLAKRPEDRPASMDEVKLVLRSIGFRQTTVEPRA